MIEVSGLTKRYGTFTAVKDLSFTVQPGEVMGLVGPNGAGKTTSLRCAAGIIPPTAGTLRVCGIDLATDPVAASQARVPVEVRVGRRMHGLRRGGDFLSPVDADIQREV